MFVNTFFMAGSLGKLTLHLRVVRPRRPKALFLELSVALDIASLVDISASMGILAMLSIIISSKMQRLGIWQQVPRSFMKKGHRSETDQFFETPESYQPTFPQIAMLSDKDMAIVREVFRNSKNKEYKLLSLYRLRSRN